MLGLSPALSFIWQYPGEGAFIFSVNINDRCCLDVFVCLRIWEEVKQCFLCFTKHMLGIRGLIVTFICFAYPLL